MSNDIQNTAPPRALRLSQIVNDPKRGKTGILPICKSAFWRGVKSGIYPPAFKLNARTTVWDEQLIFQVAKGTYSGLKSINPEKYAGRKPKIKELQT